MKSIYKVTILAVIVVLLLATLQSNGQDTTKFKLINCRDTLLSRFEKGKDPLNGMATDLGWHPSDHTNYYTHYKRVICDTIWIKPKRIIKP